MITREISQVGLEHSLMRPAIDIDSLVRLKLPPLNRTVLRISELLRDPNISTKKLTDAVGFDPILAARLLKMANSSLYSRKKVTTSIQQAIEALGLKSLYDIVMLGAMADGFAKEIGTLVYGRVIWEHSIAVGLLSRELSDILDIRGTEEAFLCGLLHDIGKILLLKAEPERFESLLENKSEIAMLTDEELAFGLSHAEVGAYVTHKWHLPETVCSVILYHHKPRFAQTSTVITFIVNVADLLANANGYGVRLAEEAELLESDAVKKLNLTPEQLDLAWTNIQDSVKEVLTTFR